MGTLLLTMHKLVLLCVVMSMTIAWVKTGPAYTGAAYAVDACCAYYKCPAGVADKVKGAMWNVIGNYRLRRRMLSTHKRRMYDWNWVKTEACKKAYNAAAGAAGVPDAVAKCFERDVVNKCVQEVSKQ